jgi:hypothetical protein
MSRSLTGQKRRVNRRAFLRGAAGVSVALPFLESLPQRSAWAATEEPVFGLFISAVGGVVAADFFPDATGPLTQAALRASDKAVKELADHADNLLFLSGINWPADTGGSDSHVDALCMALTAKPPLPIEASSGNERMAAGPSADAFIASRLHPGRDPLALYAGRVNNGYAAQRLSFRGPGELTPVIDNPYTLYQQLVGLASPDGGTTPEGEEAAQLLLESRKSVHDLVREELTALMGNSRLSATDKQRLMQHFDGIREAEKTLSGMGDAAARGCTRAGLDVTRLEALKDYVASSSNTEQIVELHLSLVALAFACNHGRAASLQWGDPYDSTIYDVPSNERRWKLAHISHRAQSDSSVGDDALAAQAHAEIDVVRMRTLAAGLEHFKARGLEQRCFVMWTNQFADGPFHSFHDVPHIIWGSAGGYLKQGAYLDAGGVTNNQLLNTLITAAIRDTGEIVTDFGQGSPKLLDDIVA